MIQDNYTKFYDRGRMHELNSLEELYERNGFKLAVVYGRRRIGKTSLISEFIKRGDKKSIRFIATENTDIVNRGSFSEDVFEVYPDSSEFGTFATWEKALKYVAKEAGGERLVIGMDEYPYLAKSHPPISSEIQKSIDTVLQGTNILLILCGSSMSFMENQVLGYQSPLYGRRTAQYRIGPLDYYDSAEFFGDESIESKLLGYAVAGGTPQYLNIISQPGSVEAGIEGAFFTKNGFLFEEPHNLLKQELREPAFYNAIITAIANGSTRLNVISGKVGELDNKVAKYVKNLIGLGIIEKERPVLSKDDRNSIYRIKDNMYRFWYRFVQSNVSRVENRYQDIYKERVEPSIPDFMGPVFEDVCLQYLTRLNVNGRLPFSFDEAGRWWGGNPITKKETEIDIIAHSKKEVIVGECKWRNDKTAPDVYRELKKKAALFSEREIHYYLFSKSGFTEGLKKEAEGDDRLTLVELGDLFIV